MRKLLLSLLIIFIFAASAFAGPSMQTGSNYDPSNVAITGGILRGLTSFIVTGGGTEATQNSSDSAISILRTLSAGTGNAHGYTDSSAISRTGGIGYASYDARVKFSGTSGFDHYAGFQSSPTYESTGTIGNIYGFYSKTYVSAGATVTNNYGAYIANPLSTGTLTNNYGVFIESQTGGTNNYGLVSMNKVGIGNAAPKQMLDVIGVNPGAFIYDSAGGYARVKLGNTNATYLMIGREGTTAAQVLTGAVSNSGFIFTGGTAVPLYFGTNATIRTMIAGDGTLTHYGAMVISGTSGGLKRQFAEAVSAALSGASGSIAVNVPAGSRIIGVQLRVDTAITSGDGATSWTAAYVNTPTTAICSGQAFTKNTKFNAIHPAYEITTDVVTITITPNSGTFSAGVVRAIVYYEALDAMADAP